MGHLVVLKLSLLPLNANLLLMRLLRLGLRRM
jgi:hypothetical protein